MIALTWYETSLLLRSHKWIPPVLLYVIGVGGLGAISEPFGAGLAPSLNWAALMLVPVVAWMTRSVLTAEPPAARACIAAASGPRRAQAAALIAAVLFGIVLGLAGVIWGYVNAGPIRTRSTNQIELGTTFHVLGGGLLAALICLLVASAIGALCNPPLVRRTGPGMLTTTAAVVVSLAWSASPANAALRTPETGVPTSSWPSGLPLIAAIALLVITWAISIQLAARREG